MIQFSHRSEKITELFAIIFWTLVGFYVIFGCIPQLIYTTLYYLDIYQIIDIFDIVDIRYLLALEKWVVS